MMSRLKEARSTLVTRRTTFGVSAACVFAAGVATAPAAGQEAHAHTNRLIRETSPYLLQHAHNPVDWYAWGPEAFEAARSQDKPIFLSIGYSTCYWCHVMERESFEKEDIAALMNRHFISIKVDREERPDVDDIYMAAVQAMAGRGGWPMSIFLVPRTLEPFKGGTYFPPTARYGKPSFRELLTSANREWTSDRAGVTQRAGDIVVRLRRRLEATYRPQSIGQAQVNQAVASILAGYDRVNGGFGRGRTKFPQPARLELILGAAWDDPTARAALLHTLDRMAMGGIYDQVGGGFHRYSTDARWLVPHFEKMLYDNAQLALVYTRAHERTGDEFYGDVARETLDYVLREMTGPDGWFSSAQDAEVNAREGQSYVWTPAEIREALSFGGLEEHTDFVLDVYGLAGGTNFRDPHHRNEGARNILYLSQRPAVTARRLGMSLDDFNVRLRWVNEALLMARDERDQPHLDDKVLVEWNGLMIVALVEAARVLDEPRYLEAAERAGRFLLSRLRVDTGELARTWRGGTAQIPAFSGDYAQFIAGLIALHRSTPEFDEGTRTKWLIHARRLADEAKGLFQDPAGGAYYDTRPDQSDLFVRTTSMRDSVIPSANSTMLANLLDLHEITAEQSYLDDAAAALSGLSSRLRSSPASLPVAVLALKRFLDRYPDRVPGGTPAAGAIAAAPLKDPVAIGVSSETVAVGPQNPGRFEVTLRIDEGYHVNAHEPGLDELVGLTIQVVGRGLKLAADYPRGETFRTRAFSDDDIRVYTGTVTIPVTLTRTAPISGTPRFVLTYQVCTDEVCLRPARALLPVTVTAGD